MLEPIGNALLNTNDGVEISQTSPLMNRIENTASFKYLSPFVQKSDLRKISLMCQKQKIKIQA